MRKEIRPDVSVGRLFPKWLEKHHPEHCDKFKKYRHSLPEIDVEARQYLLSVLPSFIDFIETDWIPNHAYRYLEARDSKALSYLPKLLPKPGKK